MSPDNLNSSRSHSGHNRQRNSSSLVLIGLGRARYECSKKYGDGYWYSDDSVAVVVAMA